MATVTGSALTTKTGFRSAGNDTRLPFNLTTASGVWTASDQATKIQIADVLYLGVIPAGFEIHDCLVIISAAFTASTTCSIGYKYVDGVDATPNEDAAYFVPAGQALSSTAIFHKKGIKAPAKLTKAAFLTLTWAGAENAASGVLDIDVVGTYSG